MTTLKSRESELGVGVGVRGILGVGILGKLGVGVGPYTFRLRNADNDGAKTDQHVGPKIDQQYSTYSGKLPREVSVFAHEMYAIRTALTKILETIIKNKNYIILGSLKCSAGPESEGGGFPNSW